MYEVGWRKLGYEMPLLLMRSVVSLLVCCLGGTRGYEAIWIDLVALRYGLNHCESVNDKTSFSWPVAGRFKTEHGVAGSAT